MPNLYSTDADDQPMNEAMETARKTFSKFDSAFESGRYDKTKFSIKVKFPDEVGNEYIWLTEISKQDGHYSGLMTDTPRITKQVKIGDKVTIVDKDIKDWLYGNDSVLHGGYTLRLIRSRMTSKERAENEASFRYRLVD